MDHDVTAGNSMVVMASKLEAALMPAVEEQEFVKLTPSGPAADPPQWVRRRDILRLAVRTIEGRTTTETVIHAIVAEVCVNSLGAVEEIELARFNEDQDWDRLVQHVMYKLGLKYDPEATNVPDSALL